MRKKALVTGGAHPAGIGFAAARALARDGYDVIVTGLTDREIALTPRDDHIRPVTLQVSDTAAVAALVAGLDGLDALVNCAGMSSLDEFNPESFARTIDVNLTGTMRVSVAARPLLAARKGAIVNIASMYATFGSPVVPGYAASKGAVVQLTKSLAAAWAREGIRVNAISPGWIRTGMAKSLWENPQLAEPIAARTPMGRWGEAEECGDVIAFLCSQQSRFVTGVTIPVDGGYLVSG